jgi:hypothetical protein
MRRNMQVQIAIGENHRFELREALLVYYGTRQPSSRSTRFSINRTQRLLSDRHNLSP